MEAKIQRPITFKNMCECNYDYISLVSAMFWYSNNILNSNKKVFISGVYPAVSMGKTKIHIHRLLMCWKENRMLESNEHVHHIDGDILNADIDNLRVIDGSDHVSSHLKGKRQDKVFAIKRTNKACLTRYGHTTNQYNEYIRNKRAAK